MATCIISGTIKDLSETALEGVKVQLEVLEPFASGTDWIAAKTLTDLTDSSGDWELTVLRSIEVRVTIQMPTGSDSYTPVKYVFTVPDAATADFTDLI